MSACRGKIKDPRCGVLVSAYCNAFKVVLSHKVKLLKREIASSWNSYPDCQWI